MDQRDDDLGLNLIEARHSGALSQHSGGRSREINLSISLIQSEFSTLSKKEGGGCKYISFAASFLFVVLMLPSSFSKVPK